MLARTTLRSSRSVRLLSPALLYTPTLSYSSPSADVVRSLHQFSTTPRRLNSFKSPQDEKRERDRMYWTIGGIAALGAAVLWYANKEVSSLWPF